MEQVHVFQSSRIKLNIGGMIYETSLDTLQKDENSMLGAMFSGKYKMETDEDGHYFIDRDGTWFRYVLNFLRNGTIGVPKDQGIRDELLKEAEFYNIEAMIDLLTKYLEKGAQAHTHLHTQKKLPRDQQATSSDELESFAESQRPPKSKHHPMPTYPGSKRSPFKPPQPKVPPPEFRSFVLPRKKKPPKKNATSSLSDSDTSKTETVNQI